MAKVDKHFWVLISMVGISGFSQGMLLPLIAIILEGNGVSSSFNGLNATALYLGILLVTPFIEQPLRKFGFKPIITTGGLIVGVSIALFPLWESFWYWFLLRLLIGIGDHALHFGTQTWITSASPISKRGKNISLYGLFFGVGFAAGPLMAPLLKISEALPFIISSALCLLGWSLLLLVKNEHPEETSGHQTVLSPIKRYAIACKYGWVTFATLWIWFFRIFLKRKFSSLWFAYRIKFNEYIPSPVYLCYRSNYLPAAVGNLK